MTIVLANEAKEAERICVFTDPKGAMAQRGSTAGAVAERSEAHRICADAFGCESFHRHRPRFD